MNQSVFVRSHVERCLQQLFATCDLIQDEDGDYPFNSGTSACFVQVASDALDVRVLAIAADGLRPSAKLLAEINEINLRCRSARVQLADKQVQVVQVVPALGCTADTLRLALDSVTAVGDHLGPLIAAVYGGCVPNPAVDEEVNTVD